MAQQLDIPAPPGSARFGLRVHVLTNGNIVVFDCVNDDAGVGSVSLYRPDGSRISTLTGSAAGDCIGGGGLFEVGDSNFVLLSPNWANSGRKQAGAATWVDGRLGLDGVVSARNSLIGSSAGDRIGFGQGVRVLANGHYVITSLVWDNGPAVDAGAVIFADGNAGITGTISADNALVGTRPGDAVGSVGGWTNSVVELAHGDFVVHSPWLDLDGRKDTGAVTWGSGTSGIRGEVGVDNSLVGARPFDRVGEEYSIALRDGRYVVRSAHADAGDVTDAGALTWVDGDRPLLGVISQDNSLFGLYPNDRLGNARIKELNNGNLAIGLPMFGVNDIGAVLLVQSGARPTGSFDPAHALVGSQTGDRIGSEVVALSHGGFVAASRDWDNGAAVNTGAVTWIDGNIGLTGIVGPENSLVGSKAGDTIGETLLVLPGGQYVVVSPYWSSPNVPGAGAVSVGDGHGGLVGPVSDGNSLVGSRPSDVVGYGGVTVLANGHLVVLSPRCANGEAFRAGAATWMSAHRPVTGAVGPANSLVGSSLQDGSGMRVFALANGHFVVGVPSWDHGDLMNAGAVVWGHGERGLTGPIVAADALIGSSSDDFPINNFSGSPVVWPLANGHYVVNARNWDSHAPDMGAVAWGDGLRGTRGILAPETALVGSTQADALGEVRVHGTSAVIVVPSFDGNGVVNGGAVALVRGTGAFNGPLHQSFAVFGTTSAAGYWDQVTYDYDPVYDLLVVGRPSDRIVSLLRIDPLLRNGFE